MCRYHSPVFLRTGQICCITAAFMVAGGHWAVLQSVAWFGMLTDYSGKYGVTAGVAKTFDGQHPCSLCKKVEQGQKKQEQQTPLLKVEKKADVAPLAALTSITTSRMIQCMTFAPPDEWTNLFVAEVATPPPRA
jgi:hypothetical protein